MESKGRQCWGCLHSKPFDLFKRDCPACEFKAIADELQRKVYAIFHVKKPFVGPHWETARGGGK